MIFELVAIDGLIFWIVAAGVLGVVTWLIDAEQPAPATVTVVTAAVFVALFTAFNPFVWVYQNPGLSLLLAIGHVMVGIGWSIIKWWLYCFNLSTKVAQFKANWLATPRLETETDDAYSKRFKHEIWMRFPEVPPKVSKSKARILTWLAYWPVSAAWTLMNDPIKHLYNFVYDFIGGALQAISDRMFSTVFQLPEK